MADGLRHAIRRGEFRLAARALFTRRSASRRERDIRALYEDDSAAAAYAAAHTGWGPAARYFRSRLHAVMEAAGRSPGGDLLDVGCGPGMLVRHVLEERPGDFRISAVDMSPAMIREAAEVIGHSEDVRLTVGRAESLPHVDSSFDVVVATGVLEYADAPAALGEIARVTRPTGLVLVTMLNPASLYRLFEWGIYWPLVRSLGKVERLIGRPPERRHDVARSGVRAIPASRLCQMMNERGLVTDDVVYYDLNLAPPPADRLVRRWARQWRDKPETTVGRGRLRGWMGSAFLVTAHRAPRQWRGRRPFEGLWLKSSTAPLPV